jgi:hypothetical protein
MLEDVRNVKTKLWPAVYQRLVLLIDRSLLVLAVVTLSLKKSSAIEATIL